MTAELKAQIVGLEDRVAERTARLAETTACLENILRSATEYAIVTANRELLVTYINPMAEQCIGGGGIGATCICCLRA